MIYLVYTSTATHPMSQKELLDILSKSQTNNRRDGITGLMLYRRGVFMQLLEGPEEAVLRCFDRICADPRHDNIVKLLQKSERMRCFEHWDMGFENVDTLTAEQKENFSTFLCEPYTPQDARQLGSTLNEGTFLLLSFKKQSEGLFTQSAADEVSLTAS